MDHIISLLLQYKYYILFPLAIVEGPILAVIAGFLCTSKLLNPYLAFPIIVCGDIIGDSIMYSLGRFGLPPILKRLAKRLGFKAEKVNQVRAYFNSNPNRTISLSKVALGIGFTGIYLAGNSKIPYKRFIIICFLTSVAQFIIYMGLGLLFGSAYQQINHYIDFLTAFIVVVAITVLLYLFIKSKRRKL